MCSSDLASWHSVDSETSWETSSLEFVEWSADWLSSWWFWVKWHSSSEENPSVTLESVPSMVEILEDVSSMMPVAFVPGPSDGGKTTLGWAPVVPSVIIPFVPDPLGWNPLPSVLWSFGVSAPIANLWETSVFLNKSEAFLLGGDDSVVLSINLSLGLTIVLLVSVMDGLHVLFVFGLNQGVRSEERRVGNVVRSRWSPYP